MITIAVATHKGGTGKTLTSMALAAALARAGMSTLLVDLDPQGHSTLGLGVDVGPGQPTLRELLLEPAAPIGDVVMETAIGGLAIPPVPPLRIVPSDIRVERQAQAVYMRPRRELVLKKALAKLSPAPAFVIVDCPPSLGALTENGVAAADWILVPCQMEARAVDGLVDLLELIAVLKGDTFDAWRIVYTKYDSRKQVTNRAVQAALEHYQPHTLETRVPQSEPLNQAQIERADIFSYAPDSKGAIAYKALAAEVMALTTGNVDARDVIDRLMLPRLAPRQVTS
jgi:chromosome partitioning protein